MKSKGKIIVVGTSAKGGMQAVIENHFENGLYDNRKVKLIISNSDGSAFKRIYLGFLAAIKLTLNLLTREAVIVHMHGSERGSIYRKALYLFITKCFGKNAVFHSHGAEFKYFYDVNSRFYRFLVRYILEYCDAIFVLSKYWHDYMYEIASPKLVEVINNFPTRAYENFFENRNIKDKDVLTFLYLGYVGERKGIYDLVDAIEILIKSNIKNFKISVAGNGELDKLKSLLSQRGLDEWFNVLGWISGTQKSKLMKESDLLVLPSYNEGLPIAILEAISAGLPVISTPVGGIPDAIQSGFNGLLIQPGNSLELSQAIEHCLNNRDELEKFMVNGKALYDSEYCAQVNISRIDNVYTELLGNN